jgi:hypothetical protein
MFKRNRLSRVSVSLATAFSMLISPLLAREAPVDPNAFDATHEIVCSCFCHDEVQTYAWEPNFDCARLNGIPCDYGTGSTDKLSDCAKKAQKKTDALASPNSSKAPPPAQAGSISPVQPNPYLEPFSVPTKAEYLAWLDGVGFHLFSDTSWPGMFIDTTPTTAGSSYTGVSGLTLKPYTLRVSSIQETEFIPGYVDPASGKLFDIQFVWLTGTINTRTGTETSGILATTATLVSNPAEQLRSILPMGALYPFGALAGSHSLSPGSGLSPAILDLLRNTEHSLAPPAEEGDACQDCYDVANRDIDRMKRDLKSCLKWAAAGGVVGGLLGALGGPWTAAGGAIAAYGIAAGACADSALDKYNDIITDFCKCLKDNDCPPHELCKK